MSENNYIYIRNHIYYDIDNICKLGQTKNIIERDSQYLTSEFKKGEFGLVFEIFNENLLNIEKLLKNNFSIYNIYDGAGTEFFDKKIMNEIELYFINNNINYKKLSKDEIDELVRINRNKNLEVDLDNNNKFKPRNYQLVIINKTINYYKNNDKGLLILTCGLGKTLISLWIAEKLKLNSILIGVPGTELLNQWFIYVKKIFNSYKILVVNKDIEKNEVINILNYNKIIIITTYKSTFKVFEAAEKKKFIFDLKICDEVHHLTYDKLYENKQNIENKYKYINMLKIQSRKQLGLTATMKIVNESKLESKLEDKLEDKYLTISNDNKKIFGDIIETKNLLWSIENNHICDYFIQIIYDNEIDNLYLEKIGINILIIEEKRLYLSAYIALKSIKENNIHHLLIYCNTIENSKKLYFYLQLLIKNLSNLDKTYILDNLFYSEYNSDFSKYKKTNILDKFNNCENGILIAVYSLGEGWDLPLLDGVLLAENMTSNIRIYQTSLRPCRKNLNEPSKKAKIILPIFYEEWNNIKNIEINKNNYKNITNLLKIMSIEDKNIVEKFRVINTTNKTENKINGDNIENIKSKIENINSKSLFEQYDDKLTENIKLLCLSRENITNGHISYEYAKRILSDKKILSKKEYYKLCEKDNRLCKKPQEIYKNNFNWIDYLSIPKIYYTYEECEEKIIDYVTNGKIKIDKFNMSNNIKKLIQLDNIFPPFDFWQDYYINLIELFDCKKFNFKI